MVSNIWAIKPKRTLHWQFPVLPSAVVGREGVQFGCGTRGGGTEGDAGMEIQEEKYLVISAWRTGGWELGVARERKERVRESVMG